jgi:hypothetical protein
LFGIVSGDITIDEFTAMMNQYVPTSTLGLRDLFNTFGKKMFKNCLFYFGNLEDLNGDGIVDKKEFDQVINEKGKDLNQDQIDIFNKKFQQDEHSQVTYERM